MVCATRSAGVRHLLVACLLLLLTLPGTAQETPDATADVFAPFVSRLRVSTRDPEIRLTWQDAEDVSGVYQIYRHTEQITPETFASAVLIGTVDAGVRSFIDVPTEPGDYHYAVLAVAEGGAPFTVFIPYRNTTFTPVTVVNIATVADRAARVTNIEATAEGTVVLVTFDADQLSRDLIVYRSTEPLRTAGDLDRAGVVTQIDSAIGSVSDYPLPGVPYYYAVVDSALITESATEAETLFTPGSNVTASPVEIELLVAQRPRASAAGTTEPEATGAPDETETEPAVAAASAPRSAEEQITTPGAGERDAFVPQVSARRPLPLPFLQLTSNLETGGRLGDTTNLVPAPQTLSSATEEAVASLLGRLERPEPQPVRAVILPEDTIASPRGAEYTLRTILDGPFARLAWEEAIEQLTILLSLPLSEDVRSRALFYRAQAYYFAGDTRRALLEFLLARDSHFTDVEPWLDIILRGPAGA